MIREILEEYFDTAIIPKLKKNEDPFWDPPNPILIGQAFLQLKQLSVAIDNHHEAKIISFDGEGGQQGILNIGYDPCNAVGEVGDEFIDQKLFVDEAKDLIGQSNLFFKVQVKSA